MLQRAILALSFALSSSFTYAEVRVGRYSVVDAIPSFEQRQPLAQMVKIRVPPRIRTIGATIRHLLRHSGYSQVESTDAHSKRLLTLDLPVVHRDMGFLPLAIALQVIVGHPYEVRVNHVTRHVCVERRESAPSAFQSVSPPTVPGALLPLSQSSAIGEPETATEPNARVGQATTTGRGTSTQRESLAGGFGGWGQR